MCVQFPIQETLILCSWTTHIWRIGAGSTTTEGLANPKASSGGGEPVLKSKNKDFQRISTNHPRPAHVGRFAHHDQHSPDNYIYIMYVCMYVCIYIYIMCIYIYIIYYIWLKPQKGHLWVQIQYMYTSSQRIGFLCQNSGFTTRNQIHPSGKRTKHLPAARLHHSVPGNWEESSPQDRRTNDGVCTRKIKNSNLNVVYDWCIQFNYTTIISIGFSDHNHHNHRHHHLLHHHHDMYIYVYVCMYCMLCTYNLYDS